MIRSLSFTYLFVILAVGYLGGALLLWELPTVSVEKLLAIFDARIVDGHEVNFVWPALMTVSFFVVAFVLSLFRRMRFTIIFVGALKCVIFGLSSGYSLATGMKILEYTVWWFPFQLITCFLLLIFCVILSPPFFMQTLGRKKRNDKALTIIAGMAIIVTVLEIVMFNVILH